MQQWTVRRAEPADAEEIARINVAAWQRAYRGIIADETLDRMLPQERLAGWRRWLSAPDPSAVLVAVDDQGAIGAYCGVGAVRADDDRHRDLPTGELIALYANPDHLGTGAGRLVHEAGLAHLADQGFRYAVLWVFETNEPSRAFYAAHGWRADGAGKHHRLGTQELVETRYGRFLPAARGRNRRCFGPGWPLAHPSSV
ncbi:GNAT family N-acetyltransferase [Goodfellowiella coeruleoviolacea]|uniref:L-amino acid N-acyltransferase YncA n=1 Tax=Goodfellowiella coeruleoviolacea TaxID=334858 RepID=A0AAE3GKW8_9PSEU|nr:GNAT family N-acetyltransferase [Goodfellowiella coeruleoviolacea]MCP2169362.1 L-amino acid N-acyltransferase YncA [Goodfellowiella coeruleoviolacea]